MLHVTQKGGKRPEKAPSDSTPKKAPYRNK
jgi:hypothetical protein